MERKGPPVYSKVKILFEFFNTPGNEVTVWSDVVGKYFEDLGFCHMWFPFA